MCPSILYTHIICGNFSFKECDLFEWMGRGMMSFFLCVHRSESNLVGVARDGSGDSSVVPLAAAAPCQEHGQISRQLSLLGC